MIKSYVSVKGLMKIYLNYFLVKKNENEFRGIY